ncbi:hypothetical protein GCM10029978_119960 [Actinoallomurus acanthiterrae]
MAFRYPMLLTFLLMIFAFCVQGEPPLPQDVQHFLSNAEMCQHLAGEWDSSLPEKDKRDIEKGVDTCVSSGKEITPCAAGKVQRKQRDYKNTLCV